jgi:energy-coupling factor transporter ATP-binding protein EcfA2
MTDRYSLFRQAASNIQRLGLNGIPFTESLSDLQSETRQQIFTGRDDKLLRVFDMFQIRERRRILVYGRIGIGKSAFLLEVLSVLQHELPKMLSAYISLPNNLDLATTALIALAKAMPNDAWAQQQLYQMGIPTEMILKERSSEVGGNLVVNAKASEKDLPITKPQYPTVSLETLIERS